MHVTLVKKQGTTSLTDRPGKRIIETETDALDLLALCGEHGTCTSRGSMTSKAPQPGCFRHNDNRTQVWNEE